MEVHRELLEVPYGSAHPCIWAWGHFARPKRAPYMRVETICNTNSPLHMGMGTLCTSKKAPPIYGHGDTLHCQKAPYVGALRNFTLQKSTLDMGMRTLWANRCTVRAWRTVWGNYPAFTPQMDPHRTVVEQ